MTRNERSRHARPKATKRGSITPGVLLALAAALLALIGTPLANSSLIAKVTNRANSTASAGYFTCTSAVSDTGAGAATVAYPFSDTSGSAAADVSGNGYSGSYSSSGVTYRVTDSRVCPRDNKRVITLDGKTGAVSGPNTTANLTVFSLEVRFKTTTAGGKLIGFGSSLTGSSGQFDRHLYIDSTGKLEFGVYPGAVKTIASPSTVTDGAWHYAVATLSGSGMKLYLDGSLVSSNSSVTTAEDYSGYLRIGYDNLSGWTNAPSNPYFTGSLAWAAAYNYALSPAQVAAHFRAGN